MDGSSEICLGLLYFSVVVVATPRVCSPEIPVWHLSRDVYITDTKTQLANWCGSRDVCKKRNNRNLAYRKNTRTTSASSGFANKLYYFVLPTESAGCVLWGSARSVATVRLAWIQTRLLHAKVRIPKLVQLPTTGLYWHVMCGPRGRPRHVRERCRT